jgi:hypothetical protein
MSGAGTDTPATRARRAGSPAAPFQSSSRTSGHQDASSAVSAASTRTRTTGSPVGRRK